MFELLYGLPLLLKALLMGLVEGLTEFLPISSTGHLIVAGALLGFDDERAKMFDVAIQTGAMLAVVWHFRVRIVQVLRGLGRDSGATRFALSVLVAFLPAAVLGVLFGKFIKSALFHPVPVAGAFVVGGVVILAVERWQARPGVRARIERIDDLRLADALRLGCAQALALFPGTSRSAATIIGGMLFGLSRAVATEFSFFLAIPTLVGAGVWETWKYRAQLSVDDLPLFAVGLLVSFVSALACVKWLLRYVAHHDFRPFAWYRIAFGGVVLLTAWTGLVRWSA